MDQSASFAFGIIIGIVMVWMGIIVTLASLPMLRGEVHSREYNYRLISLKFVKKLTDEEANA